MTNLESPPSPKAYSAGAGCFTPAEFIFLTEPHCSVSDRRHNEAPSRAPNQCLGHRGFGILGTLHATTRDPRGAYEPVPHIRVQPRPAVRLDQGGSIFQSCTAYHPSGNKYSYISKEIRKPSDSITLQALQPYIKSKTIRPQKNYRRYSFK